MDNLGFATETARIAGDFIHERFGRIGSIERKKDKSLVTDIDREAERLILDRIYKYEYSYGILAEETGTRKGTGEYLWVIDPLDGTHNFIRGNTMYGVSIGLAYKGVPAAGVIYLPASDEMYTAEKGSGAFKNGRRISVSTYDSMDECTLLFDSGFHTKQRERMSALANLAPRFFNVRMLGASSRNLTFLAEGKADALVEFDELPWDFAAGSVIITEAGGKMTGFGGKPVTLDDTQYIAGNDTIHDQVMQSLGLGM